MHFKAKFWLQFSLLNLLIVALLGLLMRYKIGFEFPFLNQKNLQHSHSHFAFAGWISHTLMVLMVGFLEKRGPSPEASGALGVTKKGQGLRIALYNKMLTANLICAYGMLVFFIIQGYAALSIAFSTASIFVAYLFGYQFWNDLKQVSSEWLSVNWFKAAIFFNVISSLGTFFLAFMMITKNIHQNEYLASIYYYLHFQYNGWFFFACMGLLFHFFDLKATAHPYLKKAFWQFFIACIPAYFLSTLWLNLPVWIYVLTVLAALFQSYAWFKLLVVLAKIKKGYIDNYPFFLRYIILFVAIACSLKLLLQLGSTIPALSQLAFGFRPIVIAYLHLVLLAVISLFLLFYMYVNHYFYISKPIRFGIILFSVGVFLNELVLAVQGIASFSYTIIPRVNELLFGVAVLLVSGIAITTYHSIKKVKIPPVL
ncbi:hypothetical protein [Flavobacterium sedimenticola]|uniref:Beta-carotene 15,15'-monooxygenase n=1 Tax=Flavobacterium sedimenticola TaxID=3043286 RepID=A0ABT6XMC6_9FLAO|nr:hypothetical protein [Flavobacterium sedimenticola]MDI9256241.1 hypothetical protein [Flavobacterium sedimenticola]